MPGGLVVVRGGGDLASGAALRLYRAGMRVAILEMAQPLVVRRGVAFAQAVFSGVCQVEECTARLAQGANQVEAILAAREIPVLVDPSAASLDALKPLVLVDGRMTKRPPELSLQAAPLVIGLGPGFVAGENCHAVIETRRGHTLGRVIWQGPPAADTGQPETVGEFGAARVLRSPCAGEFKTLAQIGDSVQSGQPVAVVGDQLVLAPFDGILRGLLQPGLNVWRGLKIGDLDPRGDPTACWQVSDKALAVGGGVVEACLLHPEVRDQLFGWHQAHAAD